MTHVALWQRPASLRGALLLKVIVPLMAIMFGFSSVVLWTVERNSERRLQAEVELVARAVADVAARGDRVVSPVCWYVADWFAAHPERAGVLAGR